MVKVMDRINVIVFVGLLISGFALLSWFFFGFILDFQMPKILFGLTAGVGMLLGWFFGACAMIVFVIGTSMFLIGKINDFWQSLYPINFGLTSLGVAVWQYNKNMPTLWVLATFISAITIAFVLYKTKAIKSRWLLIMLIGMSIIIDMGFWGSFMQGVIFASLAVFKGAVVKAFKETDILEWFRRQ